MKQQSSKLLRVTGNILKWLVALFLFFDAIMKLIKHPQYVSGTRELGLPEASVQPLGVYLLVAAVLYLVRKTASLGAILVTAYLGGAVAITYAAGNEGHPYFFPIGFAVVLWVAAYSTSQQIKSTFPFVKE